MRESSAVHADAGPFLEALAAELTAVAYPVALRHRAAETWLDLQLELWQVLTETVMKWGRESSCTGENYVGTTRALVVAPCLDQGDWNMKIEKASQRGQTTVRLSGQFQAEHIDELKKQLQIDGSPLVLDLMEVTVVDLEVVRFLGACEANGVKVVQCPRYIREWMNRERKP